jgi:glycosyltransferase involved in cell wall biosynthesis
VTDRVNFLGRRPRARLRLYYNAADVFVTTPWYEPFGITPLEAMACSTPVIGADVGGIRYSVAHGETGLLVPPKDPLAVARGLVMLKRDPQRAQRMGAAGLARAKEMFTWESVADTLSEVYARVAGIDVTADEAPRAHDNAHDAWLATGGASA